MTMLGSLVLGHLPLATAPRATLSTARRGETNANVFTVRGDLIRDSQVYVDASQL